jgi:DNA-binding response OmpR family regulator
LYIEDDPEMRGLIQLIFARRGHHLIGVTSGEFGLELLKSLDPDVLLLDLMLPDIDGWELYQQLKKDPELCKMPIVIISARSQRQDAASGHKVIGQDRFVQKPFEVKNLMEAVEAVLYEQELAT